MSDEFDEVVVGSPYLNLPRRSLAEFLAELDAGLLDPKAVRAPRGRPSPGLKSGPTDSPGPRHPIRKRRLLP